MPKPQIIHLSISLFTLSLLALCQVALAGATPWVELDLSSGHLRLATEIDGVAGESIIDTGANFNGINRAFLVKQGLTFRKTGKIRVSGVHEEAERAIYGQVPGKVFGIDLTFRDLVEVEFGSAETQLLLGADFLSSFIFQFDYPNSRMRMLTRDTFNLKKLANLETKRDQGGGLPIVKVNLNGEKKVWLALDTGSTGGLLLERNLAKRLNWLDRFPVQQSESRGVNASSQMEVFQLPLLNFGPFELENTFVSVPATNRPLEIFKREADTSSRVKRRPGKAQGLLGFDVLKHFVLTIDYKTGRAHVAVPKPAE